MASYIPFREKALEILKMHLGEPEVIRATAGLMYRWVLERSNKLSVYVTLDSPEMPEIAHIIVSDPKSGIVDPVASITMRTLEEVETQAKLILKQWREQ